MKSNLLYKTLLQYNEKSIYPMHMPGHKRNINLVSPIYPYKMDITEIEGFDDLHDANGILKLSMDRAAVLYGSEQSFYLINGSTVGILIGIAACTNKGDSVLVARNCHKSVYHSIYLNELNPIYTYPQYFSEYCIYGGISPIEIENLLITYPKIKLVIITSPTYEGMVSNISEIAKITRKYKVPLLVDEAHGAHFGFHNKFPCSSIQSGADIVIHSLHKTLPSFTQTALLHINGTLVNRERIKRYFSIYQTSSPSYLLMSSIDACISFLEEKKTEIFNEFAKRLTEFYSNIKRLKKLYVFPMAEKRKESSINSVTTEYDWSKIIIMTKNVTITGTQLAHILLYEYKIQVEFSAATYVLAITSICDTNKGFERLEQALFAIDSTLYLLEEKEQKIVTVKALPCLSSALSITKAYNEAREEVLLEFSVSRISADFIYLYPPGIPFLVPGELITKEVIALIDYYKKQGLEVKGLTQEGQKIRVVN